MVSNNYIWLNHFEYRSLKYAHTNADTCVYVYVRICTCNTLRLSLPFIFILFFFYVISFVFFFISNLFLSPNKLYEDRDLFHGKSLFLRSNACMRMNYHDDEDGRGGG